MRTKLLIAAIGVALAAVFGYNRIYRPQHAEVARMRTQIAEERARQQAQVEVAAVLDQVQRYRKRLPGEADSAWLVREVVALSEHTGVQFTRISQEPPQDLKQFTRLAASFQCSASYHQLGTLLDSLEHADHFLRVEQLNIGTSGAQGRAANVSLIVSTLYIPPALGGS